MMAVLITLWQQYKTQKSIWLLWTALILAVTATTTVQFSTESIRYAVSNQARELLAADAVLSSGSHPVEKWQPQAEQAGLQTSQVITFSSMLQANDGFELVTVKAVQQNFPLRGSVQIDADINQYAHADYHGQTVKDMPTVGTIWLPPRLFILMDIKIGQMVTVGDARLKVTNRILRDTNQATGFAGFAPTVIINIDDVATTQAIRPGSRIDYRLLLAGTPNRVAEFVESVAPQLSNTETIQRAAEGNRRLLRPVEILEDYAQLAIALTLLLCGIAIGMTTSQFSQYNKSALALIRCLGASKRQLTGVYGILLLLLWLTATAIGTMGALLLAAGVVSILADLLPQLTLTIPIGELITQPLLVASMTAACMLIGFALPQLLRLRQVTPLMVLRQDISLVSAKGVLVFVMAWGLLLLLLWVQTGRFGFSLMGVMLLTLLAIALYGLVFVGIQILRRRNQVLSGRIRQPHLVSLQLVSLSFGCALLGLISVVQVDLVDSWQAKLPQDAPNQFALGLPVDEADAFKQQVADYGWRQSPLYPVIRGRLEQHNGTTFSQSAQDSRGFGRERTFTEVGQLPDDNKIVEGKSFDGVNQISVEVEIAERLGINIGDTVTISVPSGMKTATVVNTRTVDWSNLTPNFYFVYSKGSLSDEVGSYLTSFYVPRSGQYQQHLADLIREHPTTLLLDVEGIVQEVKKTVQLVGKAFTLLASLVVLAGLLVLMTSLQSMVQSRYQEMALLRALGISQSGLRQRILIEMGVIALSASVIAIVITEGVSAAISGQLDIPMRLHLWWWGVAPVLLIGLTLILAQWQLSKLWRLSPMTILRQ